MNVLRTPATARKPQAAPREVVRSIALSPDLARHLVWVFSALLISAYAYKHLYAGDLVDVNAMDYAQIARNLATGHGFSTGVLRPLAITGLVTPSSTTFTAPDISRAPLYPLVLMLAFLAHGGHGGGNVVVMTSLAFFLASAVGVYLLARTLFASQGQPGLALLASGLYVVTGNALGEATTGLPVSLTTLLVCLLCIALFRAHEVGDRPAHPVRLLAVGALLGLCYLAQYSLLALVPVALAYVFASRPAARALPGVGLCIGGFIVLTLPWLIRTAILCHGNPFFSLSQYGVMADTSEYPGQSSIYRSVLPTTTPLAFFWGHLPEMARKASRGLAYYNSAASQAIPAIVLAPALASFAWQFSDLRVGILRLFVLASAMLILAVSLFTEPSEELIACFSPVVIVIGVGFAHQLMARQNWTAVSQRAVFWAWGAFASLGLVSLLLGSTISMLNPVQNGIAMLENPPVSQANGSLVYNEIHSGVVMTDSPWDVTWRTNLPTLWLPADSAAFDAATRSAPATSLLLTSAVGSSRSADMGSWVTLSRNPSAYEHHQAALQQINLRPQNFDARIARTTRLAAAGKIKVTRNALRSQIADAKADMQTDMNNDRDDENSQFDESYGAISEILAAYQYKPSLLPEQTEANGLPSILFLRRDFLKGVAAH